MIDRNIKVQVIRELDTKAIANIVITAFEGGISYWCPSAEAQERTASGWHALIGKAYDAWRIDGCGPYANPEFWVHNAYVLYQDESEDGHFTPIEKLLTMNSIGAALNKMARDGFGNTDIVNRILSEDYDANDADVVVQYAVFGEVVYG